MWRFFLQLCVLSGTAIAQQSLVLTFSNSTNTELNYKKTNTGYYNHISDSPSSGWDIFTQPLIYTDGTLSNFTVSIADVANKTANVTSFSGDAEKIKQLFGTNAINGVLTRESAPILQLSNLTAGSYTLHVLAARGNKAISEDIPTTYSLAPYKNETISVTTSIEAFSTSVSIPEPQLVEETSIKAYTINTSSTANYASNWVLIKFDIDLENDITKLTLNASGNYGNIAGIVLTTIPEPTVSMLSVITFAALAFTRRRKL